MTLDDGLQQRLVTRYGEDVRPWLAALPALLRELADRWGLQLGEFIPRGSMSAVVRCTTASDRPAVLKVCPDRDRLANEAAALAKWSTDHVASVDEVDVGVGALLIEGIVPGTMLAELPGYPADSVAELLASLHRTGIPDASYPSVGDRVAHLFDAWARHRRLHPNPQEVVSDELFARGRARAEALVDREAPTVLLHGDLTPVNVLDGGVRGLVAIDPSPCLGDPAFDAVDLLFWNAHDVATIETRASALANAVDGDATRLIEWCTAFAGMVASELAANVGPSDQRVQAALALARSG